MDVFQAWVDFWNPVARPTADLATVAAEKYRAGEITQEEFVAAMDRAREIETGIADDLRKYRETVAGKYSFSPGEILKPVTDQATNVLVVAAIVGIAYLVFAFRSRSG